MSSTSENVNQLIGHLFRNEAGKMAAVLVRTLGTENFSVAEDLVQDTLMKATETWPFHGIPENPSAWLYRVAKNKAIDYLRNQQVKNNYERESKIHHSDLDDVFDEEEIKDSVLRMMFACCHPSIPTESQIALTLKTLGGLSSLEIAKAFFTTEETISKRIYRAKEKIKTEKIQLVAPGKYEMINRLSNVLKVLYLIFNEGYYSTQGNSIAREDLCEEAMRLNYLLMQHPLMNTPKVKALMALMCFQASRFDARMSQRGEIILLEEQDRSKWNKPLIRKGMELLEESSEGEEVSEYHVEAAIASVHSLADDFASTRWEKLVYLYDALNNMKPSPAIDLCRAIAIGYYRSSEQGVSELLKIASHDLGAIYWVALGNFYCSNHQQVEAVSSYQEALKHTTAPKEIELIERKIKSASKH